MLNIKDQDHDEIIAIQVGSHIYFHQLIGKEIEKPIRDMPFLCMPDLSTCYFALPEDRMYINLKD